MSVQQAMKKQTAILGATGSIGQQALEVIDAHQDLFALHTLTAHSNVNLLARQVMRYKPRHAVITNEKLFDQLKNATGNTNTQLHAGPGAVNNLVQDTALDVVLTAVVGFAGLQPTAKAIAEGKTIALANKETLVVAGELIMPMAQKYGAPIYPVDSEHSAIFQVLQGEPKDSVEKIYLTASGGPFRDKDMEFLKHATRDQALNHPTWCMGAKITIDSASMMNKGLEVIEAKWLFDLQPGQIEVIVHPQSVIHSLVQFIDGSLKAQMGFPDMRLPIQYALGYPHRINSGKPRFRFMDYPQLTFELPDFNKFRNLSIAYEAMNRGGNIPCVMNAANEVAVDAFLKEKLTFVQISDVIEQTIASSTYNVCSSIDELVAHDNEARKRAGEIVQKMTR